MTSPTQDERAPTAIRDHLANERTFLAWVRTAVTFIGLGFAVERLVTADALGQALGLGMIVVGGGVMLPAFISFRRTERAIVSGGYQPQLLTNALLTAVVVIGAVVLVGFIVIRSP